MHLTKHINHFSIGVGTMNGILKCFAFVAIITSVLSACGGESSGESTGTMSGGLDLSLLSEAAVRGYAIYQDPTYSCAACHGNLGEGGPGGPVNDFATYNTCPNCVDVATLTTYNEAAMPFSPYDPATCVGTCASDVSAYIFEGFIQGKVLPGANNNPAINVNPTSGLMTTEAMGMASFTVSINSLPTDDVTVSLASSDINEGTVNTATLTFTDTNWTQPQTVMVTGVDDQLLDLQLDTPYTIMITATSNDPDYAAIDPADVSLVNRDDEVPGQGMINVNPTSGLVTNEDAQTATFTVVLGSQPSDTVTVGLSSSNAAEGTVAPASLVFDNVNYATPQVVTVTGVDDAANPMVDGNIAYSIVTAAAVSNDRAFDGVNPSDVAVTNNDNDVQPVISQFTSDAVGDIPYGGMVTLTWVSDGDACTAGGATANGQWTGALAASDSKTLTNLTTSGVNTFTLICTKGGIDSVPASLNVTVEAAPGAPMVNLTANPLMNLPYNTGTTLTWSTTDAVSCVATSNPANVAWDNANKGLMGTQVINNLTAATNTFTLTCANVIGVTTAVSVNVTVVQPNPTLDLTASAATIDEGRSVVLTWNTNDLVSCDAVSVPANAQWMGAKGVLATQNQTIDNLFVSTTFTLNCVGTNAANLSDNVTVTINPMSTGEYLYQTETFGGVFTCANAACHGPNGDMGVLLNNKANLCTTYVNTTGVINKIVDTMPIGFAANCGADCSTKIFNYMFMNFYGGDMTDCEGGALPLPIP